MLSAVVRLAPSKRIKSSTPLQNRRAFSQPSPVVAPKQTSPHIGFYKTFGRPVAKVLLIAAFTYQLSYLLWVKLEKDEIRKDRQAEISALETQLQGLITKRP